MLRWLPIYSCFVIKIKKPYLTLLIMLQTTLAHKLFCDIAIISLTDTYLPYSIFLAQPLLCERQQGSCENHFFTFGMVPPWDSNPQPPATKADTIPTELPRRYERDFMMSLSDDKKADIIDALTLHYYSWTIF